MYNICNMVASLLKLLIWTSETNVSKSNYEVLDNLVFENSYLSKCASTYLKNGIPGLCGQFTCAVCCKTAE